MNIFTALRRARWAKKNLERALAKEEQEKRCNVAGELGGTCVLTKGHEGGHVYWW